jgi:DNA-binding transcriptional MerR regulator
MDQATELLTSDVARRWGVSPNRVRQLADSGVLPTRRTLSGVRLYRLEDIERVERERAGRLGCHRPRTTGGR